MNMIILRKQGNIGRIHSTHGDHGGNEYDYRKYWKERKVKIPKGFRGEGSIELMEIKEVFFGGEHTLSLHSDLRVVAHMLYIREEVQYSSLGAS